MTNVTTKCSRLGYRFWVNDTYVATKAATAMRVHLFNNRFLSYLSILCNSRTFSECKWKAVAYRHEVCWCAEIGYSSRPGIQGAGILDVIAMETGSASTSTIGCHAGESIMNYWSSVDSGPCRLHSPHPAAAAQGCKKLSRMPLYWVDHIVQTIDCCNNDYVTAFHPDGQLWRACSHALLT